MIDDRCAAPQVNIFEAPESVKRSYLRKWLCDPSHSNFDIRAIIDWDYYKARLDTCINKIVREGRGRDLD